MEWVLIIQALQKTVGNKTRAAELLGIPRRRLYSMMERFGVCWSFMVDFENTANPYEERKESIAGWKQLASNDIKPTEQVRQLSKRLQSVHKIKPKDALHLACAIKGKCGYFLTTDKQLLKKSASIKEVRITNPIDLVMELEKK